MRHPPTLSQSTKIFAQLLFSLPLQPDGCPPPPAVPGSHQPLAGTASPGDRRTLVRGAQGCWAAASCAGPPSCPRTAQGHGPSPHPTLPRVPIFPQGEPGHSGAKECPPCWLLGERWEASGGKPPTKEGCVCSLHPARFVFSHKLDKQPRSPQIPVTCKHRAIRTMPCVPETYLQT